MNDPHSRPQAGFSDAEQRGTEAGPPVPESPVNQAPVPETTPTAEASVPDSSSDEPAVAEPAVQGAPAPSKPVHWRRVRVLSALVVILAMLAGLFAYMWARSPEDEVRVVAERVAHNLVNFDYRTIDDDVADIRRDATGGFLQQFRQTLEGSVQVFRDAIVESEGRSQGSVRWVTVGPVESDRVTAVVQVSQSVTNVQSPEPVTELRTMQLSVVRTPSGWKVDDVSLLDA